MTSDEARGKVLDYTYGEMSPDEAAAFEAVLASDPALRAEVEAVRAVREAASGLAAVPLPVDVRVRLLREAERYARKKAGTAPVFWSFLERFLLSPAFTGAMVVVVALGVGVHLLLEMGTEDRLSRIERAERAAVSRSEPAGPPAREPAAPVADKAEAPPAKEATAGPAPEKARRRTAAAPGPRHRPTPVATGVRADRLEAGGGRAGLDEDGEGRRPGEEETREEAVTTSVGRLSPRLEGKAAGARSGAGGAVQGGAAASAPRARPEAEAPRAQEPEESVARQAIADDRERDRHDARADLARARQWKAKGALEAALTAYRTALRGGTLTGSDLAEALAEAAEVAIALKQPDTARAFLDRLRTLPGGPARAAPIERELERTDSE